MSSRTLTFRPSPEFVAQLHQLSDLSFDPASFRDFGDGTAQVDARVTPGNGQSTTWTTYLVLDESGWKLSATVLQ